MEKQNPEKLSVELRDGVTWARPVIGRKYTLTHSDITAELLLTIGLKYAYDNINEMRDEVFAQWGIYNEYPVLYAYVYVDGEPTAKKASIRNEIFRRELPLALEAIRYGDREFFSVSPELNYAPIWIHFDSINPYYNRFEYWGTPDDYK